MERPRLVLKKRGEGAQAPTTITGSSGLSGLDRLAAELEQRKSSSSAPEVINRRTNNVNDDSGFRAFESKPSPVENSNRRVPSDHPAFATVPRRRERVEQFQANPLFGSSSNTRPVSQNDEAPQQHGMSLL